MSTAGRLPGRADGSMPGVAALHPSRSAVRSNASHGWAAGATTGTFVPTRRRHAPRPGTRFPSSPPPPGAQAVGGSHGVAPMFRLFAFLYGTAAYAVFLLAFLYA